MIMHVHSHSAQSTASRMPCISHHRVKSADEVLQKNAAHAPPDIILLARGATTSRVGQSKNVCKHIDHWHQRAFGRLLHYLTVLDEALELESKNSGGAHVKHFL